jgi:hypothetical protein
VFTRLAQAVPAFDGMHHGNGTHHLGLLEDGSQIGRRKSHAGCAAPAGFGDALFNIIQGAQGGILRAGANHARPQIGAQKAEQIDDGKITPDTLLGDVDGGKDDIEAAVAQAREAGAHVEGAAVEGAADDGTGADVAPEKLLVQRWMHMQIDNGRFLMDLSPI